VVRYALLRFDQVLWINWGLAHTPILPHGCDVDKPKRKPSPP